MAARYRSPALRYIVKQQLYAEFIQDTAIHALPEDALPLGWYTRSIRPYSLRLQDTFCYFISDVQGAGGGNGFLQSRRGGLLDGGRVGTGQNQHILAAGVVVLIKGHGLAEGRLFDLLMQLG